MKLGPLAASFGAACLFAQTGGVTRLVIVGVEDYENRLKVPPVKHAKRDAETVQRTTAGAALTEAKARQADVMEAVRKAFGDAKSQDTVFVFVSGRGVGRVGPSPAALLTFESDPERPGTGVTLGELEKQIRDTAADRVVLALDVFRRPAKQEFEGDPNMINFKLADLQKRHRKLDIILASPLDKASMETDEGGGSGTLARLLVEGVSGKKADANRNGIVTTGELLKYIKDRAASTRLPEPFAAPAKDGDAPLKLTSRLLRQPVLIASAGRFNPDWLNGEPADSPPDPDAATRGSAVEFEAEGQRTIVGYGEGDQLPEDPLRLDGSNFRACAEKFGEALQLRNELARKASPEGRKAELEAAQSLRARQLFCQGRELLFPGPSAPAEDLLGESLRIDGNAPEPHNALGVGILLRAKSVEDYDRATESFRRAIALAPGWAYARHNLALAYIGRGDFDRAVATYRKAIEKTPGQAYLHYNLGALLHRLNLRAEAKAAYQQAQRTFLEQAKLLEQAGDLKRAEVFRRSAANTLNALGVLLQTEKKFPEAENSFRQALQVKEDDQAAKYNLAAVLALRNKFDEAVKLLREMPVHVRAQMKLAELHGSLGQLAEARKALDAVGVDARGSAYFQMLELNLRGDEALAASNREEGCQSYRDARNLAPAESASRLEIEKKIKKLCAHR